MSRRHESVFYPDWLQVSALDRRAHRVRVVAQPALLVGLATAVAAVLVAQVVQLAGGARSVEQESWLFPLLFGAVAALACGRRRIIPARAWQGRAVTRIVRAPVAGALAGLGTILVSNWVLLWVPVDGWQLLSVYYLGFLLLGGFAGTLATRAMASLPRGMAEPADLRVSLRISALVSMNVVAVFVSIRLLNTTGGFTLPVLVWSVLQLVLFAGVVALSRPDAELTPATPGKAMRRTRDQAIAAGVAVTLFVVVVWHGLDPLGGYLGARWDLWPVTSLQAQVILFIGWLTTVTTGLADYLRHRAVLRLLARQGHLPADLLGFLDHADSHILLRRAGGGYTFAHRLFLDHFARSGRDLDRGEDRVPGCLSGRPE